MTKWNYCSDFKGCCQLAQKRSGKGRRQRRWSSTDGSDHVCSPSGCGCTHRDKEQVLWFGFPVYCFLLVIMGVESTLPPPLFYLCFVAFNCLVLCAGNSEDRSIRVWDTAKR